MAATVASIDGTQGWAAVGGLPSRPQLRSAQADGPLAEPFAEGDRHPPTFDPETREVTLPEAFKESVRVWMEAGWPGSR